jgi:hypothetical protein
MNLPKAVLDEIFERAFKKGLLQEGQQAWLESLVRVFLKSRGESVFESL